jgi:hypothetical protein
MMNERLKKAVDFIADLTKQLITVSTGIVTVTLLFSKDIFGPKLVAVWAWVFYLASTVFGLWALMALTGTLVPNDGEAPKDEDFPIGKNVRLQSTLQIGAFGIAVVLTLIYVLLAFSGPLPKGPDQVPVVQCNCQAIPAPTVNVQCAPESKDQKPKLPLHRQCDCEKDRKGDIETDHAKP